MEKPITFPEKNVFFFVGLRFAAGFLLICFAILNEQQND
jgi:hypothetical protein